MKRFLVLLIVNLITPILSNSQNYFPSYGNVTITSGSLGVNTISPDANSKADIQGNVYNNGLVIRRYNGAGTSFNINSGTSGRLDIGKLAYNMQYPINVPAMSIFDEGQISVGTTEKISATKFYVKSVKPYRTVTVHGGVQQTGTNDDGVYGDWDFGIFAESKGSLGSYNYSIVGVAETGSGGSAGIFGKGTSFNGGTAYAGYFDGKLGYTGSLVKASDRMLKEDVIPVKGATEVIVALKPVEFRYKKLPGINFNNGKETGFIAQEMKEILPHLVHEDELLKLHTENNEKGNSKYLSIDYISLIPYLVAALQEQQSVILKQNEIISSIEKFLKENNGVEFATKATKNKDLIRLYPNPAFDTVNIQLTGIDIKKPSWITLYNSDGVVIFEKEFLGQKDISFDIRNLINGTYFVSLLSNGVTVEVQRLVISK